MEQIITAGMIAKFVINIGIVSAVLAVLVYALSKDFNR